MTTTARLIEPETLAAALPEPPAELLDLRKLEDYRQAHIPGALHLDRSQLVAKSPPVGGLVPDAQQLSGLLGSIGLTPDTPFIAYDEEGGGWASRLMWTLDVFGQSCSMLLNGGWTAWQAEGYVTESGDPPRVPASEYALGEPCTAVADREHILERLGAEDFALLDSRSAEEFSGQKRLAERGGHIPGAVNLNWTDAMDPARNLRLLNDDILRERLTAMGVTPDKEVVVYCQTHHRSSHTYVMLKHLGYDDVRGYPGAWSEWGNCGSMPIET